MASNTT
jgi:hypothetical protein